MRESFQQSMHRVKRLELVQKEYSQFRPFLEDGMRLLGFSVSDMQADIGNFLSYGPKYLMVQAQREQAKTTIAALFAVWSLIHNTKSRILIVSCGDKQANQISKLIVQIIMTWDILEMLRPDTSAGDRSSVEAFDVHYALKGIDKSPSVACVGIFGNKTSFRADILIADDIEAPNNSETAKMREKLMERAREFSSLCGTGRIIYLGTPQNNDSIYNTLPSRGYTVRIWPGRYPTPEQREHYGDNLAPYIANKLDMDPTLAKGGGGLGDQGQPTDPQLKDEAILQSKELDGGAPYFQLQFMLDTSLSDKLRYPLKTSNLVYLNVALDKDNPTKDLYPMAVVRDGRDAALKDLSVHGYSFKMGQTASVSDDYRPLQDKLMFVDPAGGGKNADETSYMILGFLNGNCFLIEAGGIPGGYEPYKMEALADIALRHKPNRIQVEKNYGNGAFLQLWQPYLRVKFPCATEDVQVSGQKETRIIGTMEPVLGRGSLIVLENAIKSEIETLNRYEAAKRRSYSLFFQINHLSAIKDCLEHDDRIDGLASAINYYLAGMAIDQQKKLEAEKKQKILEWQKNPLGYAATRPQRGPNMLSKYRK